MGVGLAVMGGIQVAGAIRGRRQGKKAAAGQAAIDAENLERIKAENAEVLSRAKSDVSSVQSTGQARAAGSGFAAGGVKTSYLDRMSKVHERDLDWLESSQESGVSIASSEAAQRARIQKDRISADFISGVAGGVSTGMGGFGRAQSTGGWWS